MLLASMDNPIATTPNLCYIAPILTGLGFVPGPLSLSGHSTQGPSGPFIGHLNPARMRQGRGL